MDRVFKNKKLDIQFQKKGFVVIKLLSNDDIKELSNYFYSSPMNFQKLFTTYASNNESYKKTTDILIKKIIHPKLFKNISEEMVPFWGNFMLKTPDENTNMPLHSDWQYVNESEFVSLNVWIPLVDTDISNGALHVVPKSHLCGNYPRGINLPRYYEKNEEEIRREFGEILFLKKGEAVIYDHRLLHYSYENKSNNDRLAVTLIYLPEKAKIEIYHREITENKVFLYEIVSNKSLLNTNYFEPPVQFLNRTEVDVPNLESINLYEKLIKINFRNKLKDIISNFLDCYLFKKKTTN